MGSKVVFKRRFMCVLVKERSLDRVKNETMPSTMYPDSTACTFQSETRTATQGAQLYICFYGGLGL